MITDNFQSLGLNKIKHNPSHVRVPNAVQTANPKLTGKLPDAFVTDFAPGL